ncbi:hypothetical protein BVRB_9g210990 [Beta vulgaris subsp. vulgaris]|nr:hypothetical protein BVRB_9g210990 [Beta vulgaris subsp. vulgaris]
MNDPKLDGVSRFAMVDGAMSVETHQMWTAKMVFLVLPWSTTRGGRVNDDDVTTSVDLLMAMKNERRR